MTALQIKQRVAKRYRDVLRRYQEVIKSRHGLTPALSDRPRYPDGHAWLTATVSTHSSQLKVSIVGACGEAKSSHSMTNVRNSSRRSRFDLIVFLP